MIHVAATKIDLNQNLTRRQRETIAVYRCLDKLAPGVRLLHKPSGAPYLEGVTKMKVSVSHSRNWAVVAVAKEEDGCFGIDVEASSRPQLFKVLPRVATEDEVLTIGSDKQCATKLWTAKEAVFKAMDSQNIDFARDIHLSIPDFGSAAFLPSERYLLLSYIILDDTDLLCIASEHNNFNFKTL